MKEKDKLEQFIADHHDAFDDERPSFKVWAEIEKKLNKDHVKKRNKWIWSIAASLLLLVGMALGLIAYPKIYEYQKLQVLNQSEDFKGMERYFNGEVNVLFTELKGDGQIANLSIELHKIDEQIKDLKIELIHAPKKSKELILEAIIASFEAKVELLEMAVLRKKEIKNNNNDVQHI